MVLKVQNHFYDHIAQGEMIFRGELCLPTRFAYILQRRPASRGWITSGATPVRYSCLADFIFLKFEEMRVNLLFFNFHNLEKLGEFIFQLLTNMNCSCIIWVYEYPNKGTGGI